MMTALAADRKTDRKEGKMASHPVAASTKIYLGSLVCINASGYAVPAADTAGYTFVGVAGEQADNSSGSDGDIRVRVWKTHVHEFAASGLAVTDAGKPAYVTDDQTVTTTPGNVRCGTISQYKSATVAPVSIESAIEDAGLPVDTFPITAFYAGAVGNTAAVPLLEDLELPHPFRVLSIFADAQTAPGAGYNCTITAFGETVTIAEAATHGEDKAVNANKSADTDYDITAQDDDASGATADVKVTVICAWL